MKLQPRKVFGLLSIAMLGLFFCLVLEKLVINDIETGGIVLVLSVVVVLITLFFLKMPKNKPWIIEYIVSVLLVLVPLVFVLSLFQIRIEHRYVRFCSVPILLFSPLINIMAEYFVDRKIFGGR
jgi:hypothetical protein